MSHRYLAKLATRRLPMFVTAPTKLRRLRRLAAVGHVQVRFYPPDGDPGDPGDRAQLGQFGEVLALTAAGRTVLAARARRGGNAAL
jgi:hypothetical protein